MCRQTAACGSYPVVWTIGKIHSHPLSSEKRGTLQRFGWSGVVQIPDESIPYVLCETREPSGVASLQINDFLVGDGVVKALVRFLIELILHLLIDPNVLVPPLLQIEILKLMKYN